MPQKQPATRTVASAQDVLNALAEACTNYFGVAPSSTTLLILLAQSAGETGWWNSMWNNNLGNYKAAVNNSRVDWFFLKCWEMLPPDHVTETMRSDSRITVEAVPAADGRLKVWFAPDHPVCAFMSFPTLAAGAREYLAKLVERFSSPNDRGPKDAWHWACQGDLEKFTHALHAQGYFTADPAQYLALTKGVRKKLTSMPLVFPEAKDEEGFNAVHPPIYFDPIDE